MFDPTVYDNVKVVLEGELYEQDLSKNISIVDRKDMVDLASISRSFSMRFKQFTNIASSPYAEIHLHTNLKDFQTEMIAHRPEAVGCQLSIIFYVNLENSQQDSKDIKTYLHRLWDEQITMKQEIYYDCENQDDIYSKITLNVLRRINEGNIDDIITNISLAIQALQQFTLRYRK